MAEITQSLAIDQSMLISELKVKGPSLIVPVEKLYEASVNFKAK